MTDLPFESTMPTVESPRLQPEKDVTLEWLFPSALRQEIDTATAEGYDITVGETYDQAYDSSESIRRVFDRLNISGKEFARASRRSAIGSAAVLTAVEYDLRVSSVIKSVGLGGVRRRIKKQREMLRGIHLYDQDDVQAQPWHQQNGKALALATIVDAHDLRTVNGGDDGLYDTMSGRLDTAFSEDFIFPMEGVSDTLAGRRLGDITPEGDRAKLRSFMEAPVQHGFKDIVAYCTDSLGIRSRKEEVRAEINRYVDASEKEEFLMMSVGCGTALPILEVMQDIKQKGCDAKMILIDQDPIALASAYQFALQMGLEDSVEIHQSQLFVGKGLNTRLMDLQDVLKGRKLDVCEDSGLREYFPDAMYEDLTRQAWDALTDDGLMTTGNMNKNRPQAEFLHGLMGWPYKVTMRNVGDITRLHQKAGIPAEASRLRVTQDGVYTLCFSSKEQLS